MTTAALQHKIHSPQADSDRMRDLPVIHRYQRPSCFVDADLRMIPKSKLCGWLSWTSALENKLFCCPLMTPHCCSAPWLTLSLLSPSYDFMIHTFLLASTWYWQTLVCVRNMSEKHQIFCVSCAAPGRLSTGHTGVLLAVRRGSYPPIHLRILKSKSHHPFANF